MVLKPAQSNAPVHGLPVCLSVKTYIKMKAALIICIAIIILPLAYLATDYAAEFTAIDSCLDSGGSYDYDKNKCDKEDNHDYTPYSKRNQDLILTCVTVSILGSAVLFRLRRKNESV
jgi:hypothetical protein